jgi:hypothetical protein
VLEGSIEVTVGAEHYELGSGDCLAFVLDRPTAYRNPTCKLARYVIVIATGAR